MKFKVNTNNLAEIKNYFNENASIASQKIIEVIAALENSEVEVDEKQLWEEIRKTVEIEGDMQKKVDEKVDEKIDEKIDEKVAEEVANALAKINNTNNTNNINNMDKTAIKNELNISVFNSKDRDSAISAVKAVEVKNGISFTSGSFQPDIVDYDVANKWDSEDELFNALNVVPVNKFFYDTQDIMDASACAKTWSKTSTTEKAIQDLVLNPKVISTGYVYKRQRYAFEDIDDVRTAGKESQFIDWTTKELRDHVVAKVVRDVIGTTSNTNIEKLIDPSNNAFITPVGKAADSSVSYTHVTIENVKETVLSVRDLGDKWLIINKWDFNSLSKYIFASGGTTSFRTKEEMAQQLGVANIYVTDAITRGKVVCFVPSEYWVNIKNTISIAYPTYEFNAVNYQYEMNIGGKIHGLLSAAYLYNTAVN